MNSFYLLFISAFPFVLSVLSIDDELLSVAVIYRHGDRTPQKFYRNSPYKNSSYWPDGFGQLTNAGKQRQYRLGEWLRQRYAQFLPDLYSTQDLWVQTDNVDRTIASALANLAGLYPPKTRQIWNDELPWMPIPIHNRPVEEDAVIAMKKPCPKYKKLLREALDSEFFQGVYRDNKKVFEYLRQQTGSDIKTLKNVSSVFSELNIEVGNNMTLPQWTNAVFPDKLRKLAEYHMLSYVYTKDLIRLRTGPLLSTVLDGLENGNRKMWMYSGHDMNIVAVLEALGGITDHHPSFASTIIFELTQSRQDLYIKIFYKSDDRLQAVQVKGCDVRCRLPDLKNLLANVMLDMEAWEKECHVH